MQQGIPFEHQVKNSLEDELKKGKLGIVPECAKIYHQKSYPSKDRNSKIVIDVSLELSMPDSHEPYLIWAWECKDYGRQVPVNDIEEFHAKLEQIGLHKTKGTVASRKGFQKGAFDYARSTGIGLVRLVPDGSMLRILASRRDTLETQAEIDMTTELGLTNEDTSQIFHMFYGLTTSGIGCTNIEKLLTSELEKVDF